MILTNIFLWPVIFIFFLVDDDIIETNNRMLIVQPHKFRAMDILLFLNGAKFWGVQ